MTNELKAKIAEARMDVLMVAEKMPNECIKADPGTWAKILKGQSGNAYAAAAAYAAAERWVETHEAEAMAICAARIAARAANAATVNPSVARGLRMED